MNPFEPIGWWVEAPRYYRNDMGENFRVGRALLSPERSKGGYDNFRFMRAVTKGDVCLHLNESNQIGGISRAEASYKQAPFDVDGTSGMYVPLSGYCDLEPPLSILTEEYRERLDHLRKAAKQQDKFFFYTKELKQNMYLTPVSKELLDLLEDAYSESAGMKLSDMVCLIENV